MSRRPWFKFYPSDWRADQALRMCSIAARGLWMEMLCVMHEANPRGHLVVNGVPLTDAQIGLLAGIAPVEVGALLTELEAAGVFSRTRTGVIYSRRMTRDERKRKDGAKTAKNGTLPTSRRGKQLAEKQQQKRPPPRVVKGVVERPPPDPEARSQINTKKDDANASSKERAAANPETRDGEAENMPDLPDFLDRTKGPNNDAQPKRGTRLPVDWRLPREWAEWAVNNGLPNPNAEAERFRDYWTARAGQGGVKLDWFATWRNWVRRAVESNQRHGMPRTAAGGGQAGSVVAAVLNLRDKGGGP